RVIVMAQRGRDYLEEIYGVTGDKIDFVHHGIPDFTFVDPNFHKDRFGVEGKTVLLTFGLLSPNKGIEYVIEALPRILERHPDVAYIVQGATHPHLRRTEGEAYRLKLQRLAATKGIEDKVFFHNRFVELEELIEFISAADIYICPYLSMEQLVSGTLAYTVGAGKPVISTPLWYAEEILAEGRGMLVPPRDPVAIAEAVLHLLEHEAERHAMRKRAYMLGREMVWPQIAHKYMDTFEQARVDREHKPRPLPVRKARPPLHELPPLRLEHLRRLTDKTGILQHAKFTVPDLRHGYTLDDNARALILMVLLERQGEAYAALAADLAPIYMGFLYYAFNAETQRFRNFMDYRREWIEDVGSEDSHGRALWALGTAAGRSRNRGVRDLAVNLFEAGLPITREFTSLRAWAFTVLGIQEFLRRFYGHSLAQDTRTLLAERLLGEYQQHAAPDWPWFEDTITYCNARVPHALMLCGQWLERGEMIDAALRALDWLVRVQRRNGEHFTPIGCDGWYQRGGEPSRFDQQPVEAHSTIAACLDAYRITGDTCWMREARVAFNWFLGDNDHGHPLCDPTTGGCFDGLGLDSINQNQGAESTLAYLLSHVEMIMIQEAVPEPGVKQRDSDGSELALKK
ncbi:MAG: glycosyltransferase, partial [Candidatus Hydrogenedentes bacterium]|nr:glycosyltransferase [Candidatus Hydrogenedentota bacterium]